MTKKLAESRQGAPKQPPVEKEPKHMRLFHAKNSIIKTRDVLRELNEDILDQPQEEAGKDDVHPSLAGVLNHTGDEIMEVTDEIAAIIDEIRSNIF